jgi:hypothetical protein
LFASAVRRFFSSLDCSQIRGGGCTFDDSTQGRIGLLAELFHLLPI